MASDQMGTSVKLSSRDLLCFQRAGRKYVALSALVCLVAALSAKAAEQKKYPITAINIRKLDAAEAAKISYTRQIKPLLTENCDECHSADEHKGAFETTTVT